MKHRQVIKMETELLGRHMDEKFESGYLREIQRGVYDLSGSGLMEYKDTLSEGDNVRPMKNTEVHTTDLGNEWRYNHIFHPNLDNPIMRSEFSHKGSKFSSQVNEYYPPVKGS